MNAKIPLVIKLILWTSIGLSGSVAQPAFLDRSAHASPKQDPRYLMMLERQKPCPIILHATQDTTLQMIGDWSWGNCMTAELHQDTLAVIGNGVYVQVMNVAQPDSPKIVGQYRAYSGVSDLVLRDSIAYVLTGGHLLVLDLRDPRSPLALSETDITSTAALKLVIDSTFAYVLLAGGLEVIDLANPLQPVIMGGIAISEYAFTIAVRHQYVYVGSFGDSYVLIVDARDPSHLQVANFFFTDGRTSAVAMRDSLLYVGGNTGYNYLDLFSITDSVHPKFVSRDTIGQGLESNPYWITLTDSIAYLATRDSGVYTIRISDVSTPITIGHTRRPNSQMGNLKLSCGQDIIVAACITGLWIIHSPHPDSLETASFFVTGFQKNDIALSGDYAIVAQAEAGIAILDISDPLNLHRVGVLELPRPALDYGYGVADHVVLGGNFAYVSTGYSIDIVDISNPFAPRLAGTFPIELPEYNPMAIQNDRLFVMKSDSGIVVLTLVKPDSLVRTGSYFSSTLVQSGTPALKDSIMIVPAFSNGLQWFNIAHPDTPAPTASVGGAARSVVIKDSLAYATVSNSSDSLSLFSLNDIQGPRIVSGIASVTGEIGISGTLLYADQPLLPSRLLCIDVHDPSQPFIAASCLGGTGSRVIARDKYIYTVDGFGFHVFRNSLANSVKGNQTSIPRGYSLGQNYPNPFNPETKIPFEIPMRAHVTLRIFDILGRVVATLLDDVKAKGSYTVRWVPHDAPSGVYFYQLSLRGRTETGEYRTITKRLLLIK